MQCEALSRRASTVVKRSYFIVCRVIIIIFSFRVVRCDFARSASASRRPNIKICFYDYSAHIIIFLLARSLIYTAKPPPPPTNSIREIWLRSIQSSRPPARYELLLLFITLSDRRIMLTIDRLRNRFAREEKKMVGSVSVRGTPHTDTQCNRSFIMAFFLSLSLLFFNFICLTRK